MSLAPGRRELGDGYSACSGEAGLYGKASTLGWILLLLLLLLFYSLPLTSSSCLMDDWILQGMVMTKHASDKDLPFPHSSAPTFFSSLHTLRMASS